MAFIYRNTEEAFPGAKITNTKHHSLAILVVSSEIILRKDFMIG